MTRTRHAAFPRGGPALALVMRGGFALLAHALVAGLFRWRGRRAPWKEASAWWMVHSTLADIGCLAVLWWLLRREGSRLGDVIGFSRERLRSDAKLGLASLAVAGAAGGVSTLIGRPFYGSDLPPLITVVRVPWWARLYGIVVWPAIWATTEELVYLGYALPRLEEQLGSTTRAAAWVILFWGPIQHPTLPPIPDWRYIAHRALSATPPAAVQTAFFLVSGRRLPPLIFAHWVADFATGIIVALQHRNRR